MNISRFVFGILALLSVMTTAWSDTLSNQQVLLNAGDITVTAQDLRQQLLILPEAERTRALTDANSLKELIRRIYQNKNMALTAEQLKLTDDPKVRALLAFDEQRVLSEALRDHTRQQIQSQLPDFAALAREHYAARRDEFQLPEQFKAAHILKKVQCDCERAEKRSVIEQLRARIQGGEDFSILAKTESDDAGSAAKGGDLGNWFKAEELVPSFANALAKLEIGQISEVVETQFGLHLIKKLDYQPARLQSFDEVREKLEQQLRETYIKEQLAQKAISYLPPAEVKFDETTLQSILKSR